MNKLVLLLCSMITCMPTIYAMDPFTSTRMQNDYNGIPLPSWVTQQTINAQPDQNWCQRNPVINPRKSFVRDLIGIGESKFRSNAHWSIGNPFSLARAPHWINGYCDSNGYYRRAAIFQGQFNFLSNQDLDQVLAARCATPQQCPYFSILFPDPWLPWESDVRYLQSVACNKNAVFQIASTFFGPLEGSIAQEKAKLWQMFPHAAQGEEASASTAGATFWRKYCMGNPEYLLKYLHKLPMYFHKGSPAFVVDRNALLHYHYSPGDESRVAIGLHSDVVVTSGYGTHEADISGLGPDKRGLAQQQRLTVYTQTNPHGNIIVDTDRSQIVSQVFTSALNLNPFIKQHNLTPSVISAAKMLLRASYAATLKAAAAAHKSRVFLTLMGGDAFKNDLAWIAKAIKKRECIDTIKQHGLQVTLLYRPGAKADPHADQQTKIEKNKAFLMQMLHLFDTINGTRVANDHELWQRINEYLSIAYSPQRDSRKMHELAEQINMQLMWAPYNGQFHQPMPTSPPAPSMAQQGSYATAPQPAHTNPFATTAADQFATAPTTFYAAPTPSAHHSTRGGLEQQFERLGFYEVYQPEITRTLTHTEYIELNRIVTEVNTVIIPDLQQYKAGVERVIARIINSTTNAALINPALDHSKQAHVILTNINGLIAQLNQAAGRNDLKTASDLYETIIQLCNSLKFHKEQILSLKRNISK